MRKRIKTGLFAALFFGVTFTACESYPGYDDYVDEQFVSVSNYDQTKDFTGYKTFSIADTVAIVDNGTTTKVVLTNPQYPQLQKFANEVKENLTDAGFSYQGVNPDLGVMLSLVKNTNVTVSYPWWWWEYCSWFYWDCGYYPYYPYPYPVVVGGYTVGVLAIDMFDRKNQKDNKINAVWTGVVRGLYTGTHTDAQISDAIDQCFSQTPQFNK